MYILQVFCIYMYMYTDLESHVHDKYCHMNDSYQNISHLQLHVLVQG